MMWRRVAIFAVICALANCEGSQINQSDVMGEYRANVPSGLATLVVKPDYTWEYRIDRPQEFIRSGKWVPEPSLITPSIYVITFERFEFGFPTVRIDPQMPTFDPQKPAFWPAQFYKGYAGKVRACIMDGEICFEHSSPK